LRGRGEKWYADIYALARLRLNALGITQIYGGEHCTYRESELFFSYRRNGAIGRMGAFIWLEQPGALIKGGVNKLNKTT